MKSEPNKRTTGMRLEVDDRPRCTAEGDYRGDPVPCDLHDGHDGKHLWQKPMSFEEYVWTDARPKVRSR